MVRKAMACKSWQALDEGSVPSMYRSHTELRPRSLSGRGQDLEAENARLQSRLAELKDEAARNDSLLRKTQERELELLRAGSLPNFSSA